MKFIGIVLGGDMNSYGVCRAFYEKYKIKTIILGQRPLFFVKYSKLTDCYFNENILDSNVLIEELTKIDKLYPNTKKILFSNTDYYVKLMIYNKDKILNISSNFIVPTINFKLFDTLFNKDTFYELCDKYNITYPKSIIFDLKKDKSTKFKMPFSYPIFLKPANTDVYSRLDFAGRQKGYKINSQEEFIETIDYIQKYYDGKFIIQEYIESYDDDMYVYTFYCNSNSKVEVATGGKILMHDRSPKLVGNYNAICNTYNEELCLELKEFLEKIKFTGICHFDIIYDRKRNKYVVLEINIRQGRSNYYTLASGVNLASFIVDDYIYHQDKKFEIANQEFTVSILPKFVLKYFLKKNHEQVKIKNFHRFCLAKYDFNFIRCIYHLRWDYHILRDYIKYNKN